MKFQIFVLIFLAPVLLQAQEIRPALTESADQYLQGKIAETELIQKTQSAQKELSFNEAERAYLEDLTQKLPTGVRHELCPSFEEGLCAKAPGFEIYEKVPLLPVPEERASLTSEPSFWARNGKWIALAVVGGLGVTAWSLRDKEIQIQGFR